MLENSLDPFVDAGNFPSVECALKKVKKWASRVYFQNVPL